MPLRAFLGGTGRAGSNPHRKRGMRKADNQTLTSNIMTTSLSGSDDNRLARPIGWITRPTAYPTISVTVVMGPAIAHPMLFLPGLPISMTPTFMFMR